nr:hypothetical protein [Butyrivibrio sp.]
LVDKKAENYELRLVAIISQLLYMKLGEDRSVDKEKLLSFADDRYNEYIRENEQKCILSDICEKVKIGYMLRVKSIIDFSSSDECFDCDWDDMETAPVGLTDDDYRSFSKLSVH